MNIRIILPALLVLVGCGSPDTGRLFGPTSGPSGSSSSGGDGGSGSSGTVGQGGVGSGGSTSTGGPSCNGPCSLPNAAAFCDQGECKIQSCLEGYQDCDSQAGNGCEVHTANDTNHCGSCNNVCSNANGGDPSCSAGECSVQCPAFTGYGDCDGDASNGCETQLNSTQDCGSCGHQCSAGATCQSNGPEAASCVCSGAPSDQGDIQYTLCVDCLSDSCCDKLVNCLGNVICNNIFQAYKTCANGGNSSCVENSNNPEWMALKSCQQSNSCLNCSF